MKNTTISPTELEEFIKKMMPRAHGHQIKAITKFVLAIIEKQTGNQADLARGQGNQEAAVKQLSRLLHNPRLKPKDFAEWLCRQVLGQLPRTGKVRLTIDWTTEDDQHLLVISLVVGGRALPIYWRAYAQDMLKGRMKRYELAVIRRAFKLIFQYVEPRRIRLTADRGFPDDALFALLDELQINFVIRVKGNVKVFWCEQWRKLNTIGFVGNARRRNLGRLYYCEKSPRQLWVTMSRARNKQGKMETWYLVSNMSLRAKHSAKEYGHRFGCEEGFRDAKWYLGFTEARVKDIAAWSRLFALFAIALLVLTTLGMKLLIPGGEPARSLLRRVASRRSDRCELSLISAMIYLVQADRALFVALSPRTKLNLEASLSNVS
jgi:predicted small integral membrane protein